jgi:RNA-binding protein YhbY
MRKYEIHLPLTYSDGKPIEQEKMHRVRQELIAIFGSFLVPYRRSWKYDGAKYIEIVKIEILTTSDKIPNRLLKDLKERLKESFRQDDILITTHRIQTA